MGYSSWGCRVGHDWVINSFIFTFQGKKIEEQGSYNTCQDITNNFPSFKENKVVDHYEGKLKDFLIFISHLSYFWFFLNQMKLNSPEKLIYNNLKTNIHHFYPDDHLMEMN